MITTREWGTSGCEVVGAEIVSIPVVDIEQLEARRLELLGELAEIEAQLEISSKR